MKLTYSLTQFLSAESGWDNQLEKKTNLFHKMKKIYLKKEFKKIIKKILPFYQSQK